MNENTNNNNVSTTTNVWRANLCVARHPNGIDESVFSELDGSQLMDFDELQAQALAYVLARRDDGYKGLHLYVTGASMCLVAAINACHFFDMPLVAYHYNRDTGEYVAQNVL